MNGPLMPPLMPPSPDDLAYALRRLAAATDRLEATEEAYADASKRHKNAQAECKLALRAWRELRRQETDTARWREQYLTPEEATP